MDGHLSTHNSHECPFLHATSAIHGIVVSLTSMGVCVCVNRKHHIDVLVGHRNMKMRYSLHDVIPLGRGTLQVDRRIPPKLRPCKKKFP